MTINLRFEPSYLMEVPWEVPPAPVEEEEAKPKEIEGTKQSTTPEPKTEENPSRATSLMPPEGKKKERPNSAASSQQAEPKEPEPVQEAEEPGPPPEVPPPGFRWWCEGGLVENMLKVATEFRRWRQLIPVKLCEELSDPLVVISIKEGLIDDWNHSNDQEVLCGHHLVEPNADVFGEDLNEPNWDWRKIDDYEDPTPQTTVGEEMMTQAFESDSSDESDLEATWGALARQRKALEAQVYLEEWLRKHKFTDINQPRSGVSVFLTKKEVMYPLHVAAETRRIQSMQTQDPLRTGVLSERVRRPWQRPEIRDLVSPAAQIIGTAAQAEAAGPSRLL
eukprot:g25643.t1